MADNYSSLPLHLCFFLVILFAFVSFTWYVNYENIFEPLFDQIKFLLMLSPLLLLLVVHLLSYVDTSSSSPSRWFYVPLPEQDSVHRGGGTPWGVALLLVLLLFMLSYQSDLRERWFPLLSKWCDDVDDICSKSTNQLYATCLLCVYIYVWFFFFCFLSSIYQ